MAKIWLLPPPHFWVLTPHFSVPSEGPELQLGPLHAIFRMANILHIAYFRKVRSFFAGTVKRGTKMTIHLVLFVHAAMPIRNGTLTKQTPLKWGLR